MKCPTCGGTGEVTRKILWFMTVRRPCPRCAAHDDAGHDDHWRRTDDSPSSFPSLHANPRMRSSWAAAGNPVERAPAPGGATNHPRDDREAPVIVDPFAAEALTAESVAGSDQGGWEAESERPRRRLGLGRRHRLLTTWPLKSCRGRPIPGKSE